MRAACFCGATFEAAGDLAACPSCGAPALLPKLTIADYWAMKASLYRLITAHEPRAPARDEEP